MNLLPTRVSFELVSVDAQLKGTLILWPALCFKQHENMAHTLITLLFFSVSFQNSPQVGSYVVATFYELYISIHNHVYNKTTSATSNCTMLGNCAVLKCGTVALTLAKLSAL